jgi:hypothetical protein
MPDDLISEIRAAKESIHRLEIETSEAGYNLRLSRDKLKEARRLLDELLEELISGQSKRYPLFPEAASGNGQASVPATAARPPRQRRRKAAAQ